jgi:hypothetical protein
MSIDRLPLHELRIVDDGEIFHIIERAQTVYHLYALFCVYLQTKKLSQDRIVKIKKAAKKQLGMED